MACSGCRKVDGRHYIVEGELLGKTDRQRGREGGRVQEEDNVSLIKKRLRTVVNEGRV